MQTKRNPRSIFFRIALVMVAAMAGIGLSAAPAQASVLYDIVPLTACQEQGHFGASIHNTGPYGWYCFDLGYPVAYVPAGAVDMQGYCNRHFPGSRAIIYKWSFRGWRCERMWD